MAAASISLPGRFMGERFRTSVGARLWPRTTETLLTVEGRVSSRGEGRGLAPSVIDVPLVLSSGIPLEYREPKGARWSSDEIWEMGRPAGKVAKDGRREVIREIRCVIVLCINRGLEMLTRIPDILSLRVPDRYSLSRMRNCSWRSGLKSQYQTKGERKKTAPTNPLTMPIIIQARPIIRNTRRVRIRPKLGEANPVALSMADI